MWARFVIVHIGTESIRGRKIERKKYIENKKKDAQMRRSAHMSE